MSLQALALLLTQMCVGEIDFPEHPQECEVMWGVMANRSRGVDRLPDMVRRYNSVFKRDGKGRARWVLQIDRSVRRPSALPKGITWSKPIQGERYSRQQSVQRMLSAADQFVVRLHHRHVRKRGVHHYGGDCRDSAGACDTTPPCWRRVYMDDVCGGDCAQVYWNTDACRSVALR